jgi:hypothetical protein
MRYMILIMLIAILGFGGAAVFGYLLKEPWLYSTCLMLTNVGVVGMCVFNIYKRIERLIRASQLGLLPQSRACEDMIPIKYIIVMNLLVALWLLVSFIHYRCRNPVASGMYLMMTNIGLICVSLSIFYNRIARLIRTSRVDSLPTAGESEISDESGKKED